MFGKKNAYRSWPIGGRPKNVKIFTSYNSQKQFFICLLENVEAHEANLWVEMLLYYMHFESTG